MSSDHPDILADLVERFPRAGFRAQPTCDPYPTLWVPADRIVEVLRSLKRDVEGTYEMLYDLTAVDERERDVPPEYPESDFTLVYHLLSFDRNEDLRLKVALSGERPAAPSISEIWKNANWYEREIWDMFGIDFEGHPHLERILMPRTWQGHPLRKEHPARATEMEPFELPESRQIREEEALEFRPEEWGLAGTADDQDFVFLNVGPQHPGTHGVLRVVLKLEGEKIVDAVPDIGFHHRGAEKMAERQTWHTYIPYTDRVDYLGGVMNNLAYLLSVERLADIEVPERARVIRVMMCEIFRIASHLVWYGTFAQDVGQLSPVFYMFTDREKLFDIVSAITGGRMHPNWFRIGGVAQDLPDGWDSMIEDFLEHFAQRLDEYDDIVLGNPIFQARTKGVGACTTAEAIEWGMTGPGLRATGMEWDFRKKRPYSGYERFEFDVPTAEAGDCFARAVVRVEEMRQSSRIIRQCIDQMPGGSYKADHRLTTPPRKPQTMEDIETLIHHFINVSWGPVIPDGEASVTIEATKGSNSYYLISDGGTQPYRCRIRAPSFPHMQFLPELSKGLMIPDLLAILGSIDYVLADVDR